jgi:glyoxylase-like metal-dependent hydrolase (beta-lactamase superfamily II)
MRDIMQITEHIHAIKIPFEIPVAPGKMFERFVYAYLIFGTEICLIDSGVRQAYGIISEYLNNLGRKPEEISLLVLTHAHPDHIGSAVEIKKATSCAVAAHPDAQRWIEDVALQFKERPVPGFHDLVGGSTPVDRLLHDGEIINLDPVSLEVVHTPGHATGSISLYCKEEGALFSGDAVSQTNDLPIYDDVTAAVASIKKLKELQATGYLFASWADPLAGSGACKMMDDGLEYLQRIHGAIRDIAAKGEIGDPMELCTRMVKIFGLPEVAVNPLVAKSFVSHMKIIDRENLL